MCECAQRANTHTQMDWYHKTAKSLRIIHRHKNNRLLQSKQTMNISIQCIEWSLFSVILLRRFACACTSPLIAYLLWFYTFFSAASCFCFLSIWIYVLKTFLCDSNVITYASREKNQYNNAHENDRQSERVSEKQSNNMRFRNNFARYLILFECIIGFWSFWVLLMTSFRIAHFLSVCN